MFYQESGIGRNRVVGEIARVSLDAFEVRFHRFVGQEGFQALGKKQVEPLIEGDESLIESGVVDAVEADSVADIEAFRLVAAPGKDVGEDGLLPPNRRCTARFHH